MKKLFFLAVTCCLVSNAWSNDSIVYKAPAKLDIVNARFSPQATDHTFQDGVGKLFFGKLNTIGGRAFEDCETMTEVVLPATLEGINDNAFRNCKGLKAIVIPDSVKSIGVNAFVYCPGLESISVAADNKVYDSRDHCNAIIETKNDKIVLGCVNTTYPESVNEIGDYAFNGASRIVDLVLPEGIQSIGKWTFAFCTGMKTLSLPSSMLYIDEYAFMGDTLLESITCKAVRPVPLGTDAFGPANKSASMGELGVDRTIPVYVPASKVTDYTKDNWGGFTNFQAISDPGTEIDEVHNAQCTMHDVRKVMKDGQLLIIRDGKIYNAQGGEL